MEKQQIQTEKTDTEKSQDTPKPQRNAADLLVECLQEEGVEYIFGIPGEEPGRDECH
mgnify:CR=1 FL=1